MLFWLTPVVVAVLVAAVSFLSRREQERGHSGGEFTISRSLIIAALAVALICLCMAGALYFFVSARPKSDASVPLAVATASAACSLIWSVYVVRLGDSGLSLGLFGKRSVSYGSIARIVEIRNQGSPRALLVTKDGRSIGIWSNLAGFDTLVRQLLAACPSATHDRVVKRGERFK